MNDVENKGRDRPARWSKPRVVMALAGLLLAVFTCAALFPLPSPEGEYYDPYIGCIGDAYWTYRGGEVSLHTPESDEVIAKFARDGGRWLWRNDRGESGQFQFRATLLGIQATGQPFLFRRSFVWVPKPWTWIQCHLPF